MTIAALDLPFSFEQPHWMWVCLLVPVLVAVSFRSLAGLDPVRRVLAVLVRSTLIILTAACLAGVQYVRRSDDLAVWFLMDRSHSVQELQAMQESYMRTVTEDVPADDRTGVIDFAKNAFVEQMNLRGGYHLDPGRLPQMPGTDRTNIAGAMRLAMAVFPPGYAKRIVLLTDGNDNMGDVVGEARRAAADGVTVDVVPLWYEHPNEIYVDRLISRVYAEEGELVPLRWVINTRRRAKGTIEIYHNGVPVPLSPEQSQAELKPGDNSFRTKLAIRTAGVQRYEVRFRPDSPESDSVSINNAARAFSFVSSTSSALLLTANPAHDQPLADALLSEKVRVDMRDVADLGQFDLLEMMNYASIILANVSAGMFTDQQIDNLGTYVTEGGGLIMLGGDQAFGAGGWIGTAVEDVMPVSFEIKHKRVIPRGALVLIMHSCEIPRGNYYGKEMAKKSVDTISSQDYFGVLAYTYSPVGPNWTVPFGLNTNKASSKAKIDRMQIGDMPDFDPTMRMALKMLTTGLGRDAAQKHVIISSDGDAFPPTPRLLQQYKQAKITVSTVGLGWGAHSYVPVMQDIANQTGGTYYRAMNARQLPQIFTKESKIVRRPLIIEEPFQPQIVQAQSNLLLGLDPDELLPSLGGMVLTSPKPDPNVLVPVVRMTDDGYDPVLAHWQYELGKSVAFTSGMWPLWGENWTSWSKYAKFWAQLVRWTMRQSTPADIDVHYKIEGTKATIVVDAQEKDGTFNNRLSIQSNLIGPDGSKVPIQFHQTGPGRLEAEVDAELAGEHLANLRVYQRNPETGENELIGNHLTGFTVPFSPEYRELRTNEALLRRVANLTGGRWLDPVDGPETHNVYSHRDLPRAEAKTPAWEWVLTWLLLPLFLLDVAVRRLANWLALSLAVEVVVLAVVLFGFGVIYTHVWGVLGAFLLAELIGWTIRFRYIGPLFDFVTHGVVALRHTGDRSAEALKKLKATHDKVKEDLEAEHEEGLRRIDQEEISVSPSTAKRKYDAGDQSGGESSGDLSEALGGAEGGQTYKETLRAPAPGDRGEPADAEDATSRLLRAKRRMREDRKED